MASLQDIRRRIKSVKSIQQITNAMNMVATSRLRKAKEAAVANKPYADKMAQVVSDIAANAGDFTHPLLEVRQEGKKLILVMASDKGLAGAYASNAFKEAVAGIEDKSNTEIVAVGRKTDAFFRNRDYEVAKSYIGISERPSYDDAKEIAVDLISRFVSGEVKEISMVYTRFVSAISCVPETVKLLPFGNLAGQGGTHAGCSVCTGLYAATVSGNYNLCRSFAGCSQRAQLPYECYEQCYGQRTGAYRKT